jgi:hypothetical protein
MYKKITKEGKGHFFLFGHRWERLENERENKRFKELGVKFFEPLSLDSIYAKFRGIRICKCGAEELTEEIGFI